MRALIRSDWIFASGGAWAATIAAVAITRASVFNGADYTDPVRVLGIDYGARRMGLALSDATATLASPWRLLQRPPSEAETLRLLIKEITALATDDDGLEAVVVGWPRRLNGSPTEQKPIVESFANAF